MIIKKEYIEKISKKYLQNNFFDIIRKRKKKRQK